jgi:hypothetical protein
MKFAKIIDRIDVLPDPDCPIRSTFSMMSLNDRTVQGIANLPL